MSRAALFLFIASCALAQPCPDRPFKPDQSWNGWGGGLSNSRFTADAKIPAGNVSNLKLKWAFGFPDTKSVLGQPSISGGRVFIGVDTGQVYSLDASSGCQYWTYKAQSGVRTAISVETVNNIPTAFFGDLKANVYALNAQTGALLWTVKVDDHSSARITGAPKVYAGRIYVPVASGEEGGAGNPTYECCTFRGSVVALDAQTGKQTWKTYMIPDEPKPTRKTSRGSQFYGPSGAGVWSSPTIDPKRKRLYVGTGDAYSEPAAPTTDAIVALDLESGKILWSAQDTKDDVWLAACMATTKPEACPKDLGPDHDFGSPPILKTLPDGRDLLIAGQKSGNVWAHDPDHDGKVVWRTALVSNTTEFGGKIVWGGASDDQNAYFGLGPGGIGAVQLRDGERKWFTELQPTPELAKHPGQDGPLTAIPGVVFSGGWDGVLRALSATTGKVIWQYDTAHQYSTVNGVAATGGSMGAAGPVAAGGVLYVPSGYVGVRQGMPGNVLLAFAEGL
jgi:polyvinyl alcohol dehydrogenase (cytochrome)